MTWTPVFWLLAFLPALIALYFLKLRRRDVVVSSTLLWKRSLEDLHVNAPFQKLRKSWLLLLQLLVLIGLILAAWKPRMVSEQLGGRNLIVLLDNSASMSAREATGTRLELAREEALSLVRGMDGSDRMALLAFSSKTTTLEPLTSDKAVLESRIEAVNGTSLPTRLAQAIEVAGSLAASLDPCEVFVVGDGCYDALSALPAEAKRMNIKFISKGSPIPNVGITELDVRSSFEAGARTQVFSLIENSGTEAREVVASLTVDGQLRDARKIVLPAAGAAPAVFDLAPGTAGMARVSIDANDAFPLDDEAWVRVEPPRTLSILVVGKPNPWIDLVLKATSGVSFRRLGEGEYSELIKNASGPPETALGADVLLVDRFANASTLDPFLPTIYLGCLPPLPGDVKAPAKARLPVVVDWDRSHPVNRFLVFTDLYIEESEVFRPRGEFRSLVESDAGTLIGTMRYHPAGGRPVSAMVIGFDLLKTNWPIGHYSFPIFFANAIRWLGGLGEGTWIRSRTGESLVYDPRRSGNAAAGRLEPASISFRSPSGRVLESAPDGAGAFVLAGADEVGVYEVSAAGAVRERFPVALLDAAESRLKPAAIVDFGDFQVEVKASLEEGSRQLWKHLALAALLFLCLEWYVYNRRLAG